MTQNHLSWALTGFSKKKNDAGERNKMWLSQKVWGQIWDFFVFSDWNYVHWSLFPAQWHIMYVILTFLFYTFDDDDELTFSFLCFLFTSILKLEICVVAYSAWMQIWVTITRVDEAIFRRPSDAAFLWIRRNHGLIDFGLLLEGMIIPQFNQAHQKYICFSPSTAWYAPCFVSQ